MNDLHLARRRASGGAGPLVITGIAVVAIAVSLIFVLKDDPEPVADDDPAEKEEVEAAPGPPKEQKPGSEEIRERLTAKLMELGLVAFHCPDTRDALKRNRMLGQLVRSADLIDFVTRNGARHPLEGLDAIPAVEKSVDSLLEKARLPEAEVPSDRGKLVVWEGGVGSSGTPGEKLPGFEGKDSEVAAICGDEKAGLALHGDGTLSSWGARTAPPEGLKDVRSIAGAGNLYAAIHGSEGKVAVWGDARTLDFEPSEAWSGVARISAGASHVLALTRDFKLLAAGSDSKRQVTVPDTASEKRIIDIGAFDNSSFAISTDGRAAIWGGGRRAKQWRDLYPLECEPARDFVLLRDRGGQVLRVDSRGNTRKEDPGAHATERSLPRYAPTGNAYAFHGGDRRWTLVNADRADIDMAYWERTANGASDVILGKERFIAVVPKTDVGGGEVALAPRTAPDVPLVKIDDIEIPESHGFRDWTAKDGRKIRARMVSLEDGSHAALRSDDGKVRRVAVALLSADDQEFAKGFEGGEAVKEKRLGDRLREVADPAKFMRETGLASVDFSLRRNRPRTEVRFEGKSADLIIDTGASRTLLTLKTANRLGIKVTSTGQNILTWQGRLPAYEGTVASLEIGEVEFKDVKITAADIPGELGQEELEGLIGIDILKMGNAAFDFGEQKLRLRDPAFAAAKPAEIPKPDYRTWTGTTGKEIRAKWIGQEGDVVTIEEPGGKELKIKTGSVSKADREYLDLLETHLEFETWYAERLRNLEYADFLSRRDDEWTELKYVMAGNQQVVEVGVEGRKQRFFLDTGASMTKLSIKAAEAMGKKVEDMPVINRAGGLEGAAVPVYEHDFTTFQIGPRTFNNYRMAVYDFRHLAGNRRSGSAHDGVLGTDVLRELRATIDLDSHTIVMPRR